VRKQSKKITQSYEYTVQYASRRSCKSTVSANHQTVQFHCSAINILAFTSNNQVTMMNHTISSNITGKQS